jgi:hypothetical protein
VLAAPAALPDASSLPPGRPTPAPRPPDLLYDPAPLEAEWVFPAGAPPGAPLPPPVAPPMARGGGGGAAAAPASAAAAPPTAPGAGDPSPFEALMERAAGGPGLATIDPMAGEENDEAAGPGPSSLAALSAPLSLSRPGSTARRLSAGDRALAGSRLLRPRSGGAAGAGPLRRHSSSGGGLALEARSSASTPAVCTEAGLGAAPAEGAPWSAPSSPPPLSPRAGSRARRASGPPHLPGHPLSLGSRARETPSPPGAPPAARLPGSASLPAPPAAAQLQRGGIAPAPSAPAPGRGGAGGGAGARSGAADAAAPAVDGPSDFELISRAVVGGSAATQRARRQTLEGELAVGARALSPAAPAGGAAPPVAAAVPAGAPPGGGGWGWGPAAPDLSPDAGAAGERW